MWHVICIFQTHISLDVLPVILSFEREQIAMHACAHLLQQLCTVCVCRCVQISNQGASSLIRLKALQSLDLSDCNNLGDAGLQALLQGLPHLHTLALQHCTHISDAGPALPPPLLLHFSRPFWPSCSLGLGLQLLRPAPNTFVHDWF